MCTVKYDKVILYVFFIKIVYCRGSGFELLSAFLSLATVYAMILVLGDYGNSLCQ